MRFYTSVLLLVLVCWSEPAASQSLPTARDIAYIGPITLSVDATDLAHKALLVHETLPVQAGPLTSLYPMWIPGHHAPVNEVKRLVGLRIEAAGKALPWRRHPDHFHAYTIDVPAGITSLNLSFRQVLPLQPTGSDPMLGRKLANIGWQGAVLYPAGLHARDQ